MVELIIKDYVELNEEEIIDFFNKYNRDELESFDLIFYFAMSHNLDKKKKIHRDVYDKKEYIYNGTDNSDIIDKNSELNYKELNFLYNLTFDGIMCASSSSLNAFSDYRNELERINDSVYDEMKKRVYNNKNKLKLTI